ncbi:MAG: hypothetical protein IPL25_10255 [Saprospiraceae bacterium]|nr:hypothetical protein [Candidatus Vicinibacter affinis]
MQDFFENTKSIDLRTGDYLSIDLGDNDESKEIFGDKTIAEKVAIRNQALSYQRVTRLAPSFEAQEALLTAGLDSSQK